MNLTFLPRSQVAPLTCLPKRSNKSAMFKFASLLTILTTLTACSSVPVAITYGEHSLTGVGVTSPDMSTFSFKVTDDDVACQGSYALAPAFVPRFTFPISCSDGRTARIEARRGSVAMDKAEVDFPLMGKVVFSDGSYGMFNLGLYARKINTNSLIYKEFIEDLSEKNNSKLGR